MDSEKLVERYYETLYNGKIGKRDKRRLLVLQDNKCGFCQRNFDLSHETPCFHQEGQSFLCRGCLMFVNGYRKLVTKVGGTDEMRPLTLLMEYLHKDDPQPDQTASPDEESQ